MGALHEGHLSLVRIAAAESDVRVVSIFVNPVQFGPREDLAKYPRPFERDCSLAEQAGCDLLFAPDKPDMYPRHYSTYVNVEEITEGLCGASRPGHFRGVATVVLKFFNIVSPTCAVFGQKDAQQALLIKRMVDDLNLAVKIIVAPTFRESDGLAMSSRNVYLSAEERSAAPLIYQGLQALRRRFDEGERNVDRLRQAALSLYDKARLFRLEYFEAVDTVTVKPVLEVGERALVALACRTTQSGTRLIDNVILGGPLL
jgi:pantoate--beta-alanine ligase